MQKSQRFDFKDTSNKTLKRAESAEVDDLMFKNYQAISDLESAEMDSNESEMEKLLEETKDNKTVHKVPAEEYLTMVEYASQQDEETELQDMTQHVQERDESTLHFAFPLNSKIDEIEKMRQSEQSTFIVDKSSSKLKSAQKRNKFLGSESPLHSQATNESISNESSPMHERRTSGDAERTVLLQSTNAHKTSRSRGRTSTGGLNRHQNSNSTERANASNIYGKVATWAPFRDDTEVMEYQCESSNNEENQQDDGGLDQEAEDEASMDSDQRAEQLRREDMLEYEIRRLEQLNLETAQRIKEPQTTDESEEEKDLNLLDDNDQFLQRRLEYMDDLSPRHQQQSPGSSEQQQNRQNFTFEKGTDDNESLNQRDENEIEEVQPSVDRQRSHNSRKLFVIEEEQSIFGVQSTYRSRHNSNYQLRVSDYSDKVYISRENSAVQRNSDPFVPVDSKEKNVSHFPDGTRTQKFDRSFASGPVLQASFRSSMASQNQVMNNSSPDFKKRRSFRTSGSPFIAALGSQEQNLLKFNSEINSKEKSADADREDQVNDSGSVSNNKGGRIQKQTTFIHKSQPFEVISETDLGNRNFDRLSKILKNLPGADHQNTDETLEDQEDERQIRYLSNGSNNEKLLIAQLLSEINLLKIVIAEKEALLKYKANVSHVGISATTETHTQSVQTNGPRSKAYYESIPAKIDTGLMKRSDSEDSSVAFAHRAYIVEQTKRSTETDKKNRRTDTSEMEKEKRRKKHDGTPGRRRMSQSQTTGKDLSKLKLGTSPEKYPADRVESLRMQMLHLKNQQHDLQNENLQLQEKNEYLETQIVGRDQALAKFEAKIKAKKQQNLELQSKIEELTTRADSLMIDNSDLRTQLENYRENDLTHCGTSYDNQLLKNEQQRNIQLTEKINVIEADQKKYDKKILKLKRELGQVMADKVDLNRRLNQQFEENQRLVAKQPDMFDYGIQTDPVVQTDFVCKACVSRGSRERQPTQQTNRDFQSPKTNIDNKSACISIGPVLPSAIDHFSETGYGEQGSNTAAEQECIKLLIQRANDYEIQYQRIEQEIIEYKKLMQEVSQSAQPANNHRRTSSYQSDTQAVQQTSYVQMPQRFDTSQNQSASNIMMHQTPQSVAQSIQHDARVFSYEQQVIHYKKKAKKYSKRNQKLQMEKEFNLRLIQDLNTRIQELAEKYRDMKQKLHLRIQEKSAKISQLRSQVSHQIVPVQSVIDVERLRSLQTLEQQTSDSFPLKKKEQKQQRSRQDRLQQFSPRQEEEQYQKLLSTLSDEKRQATATNAARYQATQQSLLSDQSIGKFQPQGTRTNPFCASIFEDTSRPRQDLFYPEPRGQQNNSNAGNPEEIYSIISGLVDQKFAEQHQRVAALQAQREQARKDAAANREQNRNKQQRPGNIESTDAIILVTEPKKGRHSRKPSDGMLPEAFPQQARPIMTQAKLKQKSPVRMDIYVKPPPRQGRSMRTSVSPNRKVQSSSDSKPRDKSSTSHISRDDVMPCYKSQFPLNPANVSSTANAKPIVSEILNQYLLQTQNSPHSAAYMNSSQLSVLDAPRDYRENMGVPTVMQISRNSQLDQSQLSRGGKITQMLMNSHFKDFVAEKSSTK